MDVLVRIMYAKKTLRMGELVAGKITGPWTPPSCNLEGYPTQESFYSEEVSEQEWQTLLSRNPGASRYRVSRFLAIYVMYCYIA